MALKFFYKFYSSIIYSSSKQENEPVFIDTFGAYKNISI